MKICFLAPSGYGKSTAIKILSNYYNLKNIKIAEPLYELQDYFYKYISTEMIGEQDGEILQFLGIKIRKENSTFLLNFITNDDCRPPDYEHLKNLGFIFIGINGYNRDRLDHRPSNPKLTIEWQGNMCCDYWVDNLGTMEEYEKNIIKLINQIIFDKGIEL